MIFPRLLSPSCQGVWLAKTTLLKSEGVDSLDQFISEISECRGLDLIRGGTAQKLKTELLGMNLENHSFRELIGKVYDKVSPFENDDVLNGFRAVQFCIDHKLVQQGITLLLEFIVTYVLNNVECDQPMDADFRMAASGALNLKNIDCFLINSELDEDKQRVILAIAKKIFKLPYKNRLTDIFLRLSQHSRNDLNHAGFRENPKCAGYFEERLRRYYEGTIAILKI